MKLILGDCLEKMRYIKTNCIQLTVTSPPYDNLRTYNDSLDWGEHVWKPVLKELFRITKPSGVVVWIIGDASIDGSETGTSFRQALYAMKIGFRLHDTMIYEKSRVKSYNPICNRYWQAFDYMFVFSKGKFASTECVKRCGYRAGAYFVRNRDGKTEFISVSRCTYKDAKIVWRGTVENGIVKGESIWTVSRWYRTVEKKFLFEGRLVNGSTPIAQK